MFSLISLLCACAISVLVIPSTTVDRTWSLQCNIDNYKPPTVVFLHHRVGEGKKQDVEVILFCHSKETLILKMSPQRKNSSTSCCACQAITIHDTSCCEEAEVLLSSFPNIHIPQPP